MIWPVLKITGRLPGSPKCAGKRPIRLLNRELPVDDALRARERGRGRSSTWAAATKGLDDISTGLRIARQPAVLEAPAGRHTTRIRLVVADVLSAAEPVDRGAQMFAGFTGCGVGAEEVARIRRAWRGRHGLYRSGAASNWIVLIVGRDGRHV